MAKRKPNERKALEEHLFQLVKTSPTRPFISEEVMQILTRYGDPPEWANQPDEKLIVRIKEARTRQRTQAEANFRNPSQIHSLGELLDSILIIKGVFISQLAQELEIPVEEIEAYIENRPPAQLLGETRIAKIAEVTGIAMDEIRRIVAETAKHSEKETLIQEELASKKTPRPYPAAADQSAIWSVRDEDS